MRTITVTQALTELKLYDSKISKALDNSALVGAEKTKSTKIGYITKDEFSTNAKASYQSICDLIKNRATIKSKVAESNAKTYVTVDGVQMSVAEAIERKNSIIYDQEFLEEMQRQYDKAVNLANRKNVEVTTQVNKLLETTAGRENTMTKEQQESIEETYRDNNEFSLVDPLNISEKIKELQSKIDGFLSNVDVVLSVSNATTFIECE